MYVQPRVCLCVQIIVLYFSILYSALMLVSLSDLRESAPLCQTRCRIEFRDFSPPVVSSDFLCHPLSKASLCSLSLLDLSLLSIPDSKDIVNRFIFMLQGQLQ